jgi:hypothetical protein
MPRENDDACAIYLRHPEVRGRRPSLEGRRPTSHRKPGPCILRGPLARAPQDDGERLNTHHRSREAFCSPSFVSFPLAHARERSADRRSGCIGTPSRASDAGPQAFAKRLAFPRKPAHAVCASGERSPLGAPPRRFFGPEAVLPGRLPGVADEATRRTPVPPCSMPSRTNTLRGRDGTTISADHAPSKHYLRLCAALLMRDDGRARREPIIAQSRPQKFC